MDNDTYDRTVGDNVAGAISATVGSVHGAASKSGIPYTTLDRKLRGASSFTVAELRRIGRVTGHTPAAFLPDEAA